MDYEYQSSFDNPYTFADGVGYGEPAPDVFGNSWGNVATPGYSPSYFSDAVDAARFEQFTPAVQGDTRAWYERVAEYGLGRYIDNRWGPSEVIRSNNPATFAGQNGRTYTNVPVQGGAAQGGGTNLLLIGAVAVAALLLLK